MSGGFLAIGLIFTYLAHTFFFWRSGRKSSPVEEREQKPDRSFEVENEITHARLSHFAAQLGHMHLNSSFSDQQR